MNFFVRTKSEAVPEGAVVLDSRTNLITGEKTFAEHFTNLDSLERDLLLLASSVFAIDRSFKRGEREDVLRRIDVSIPVTNVGILQPVMADIAGLLRALSQDRWNITLRQQAGSVTAVNSEDSDPAKRVLLFSGGLDSLAAAHEFGGQRGLTLVSHVTHNRQVRTAQEDLIGILANHNIHCDHFQFFVSSKNVGFPSDMSHDGENTQRTRSFLFMTLGVLVARRVKASQLLMVAENGQMAVHLPLTQGRISAFSTHTAHPDVLRRAQSVFRALALPQLQITNPYVSRTKAEVVAAICGQLPEAVPVSISCWKNTRIPSQFNHCGGCIPCYIRRIAIEKHGMDPTAYARDPWQEEIALLDANDDARRNFVDYAEFIRKTSSLSDAELIDEWPELKYPAINLQEAIQMYRRAAADSFVVFAKYPKLQGLLQ